MRAASMRCDKLIQIRAPEALAQALTTAADKRLTSRSDYIRGALLDRLRADDVEQAPFAVPASNSYEFP
jgi:hypothetical protein